MPVRGLDKVGRLTKQAIPMGKINKPSRDYTLRPPGDAAPVFREVGQSKIERLYDAHPYHHSDFMSGRVGTFFSAAGFGPDNA
jgi:hypothetical protein